MSVWNGLELGEVIDQLSFFDTNEMEAIVGGLKSSMAASVLTERVRMFALAYSVQQEKPVLSRKAIEKTLLDSSSFECMMASLSSRCSACFATFSAYEMVSMVVCECMFCVDCFVTGYETRLKTALPQLTKNERSVSSQIVRCLNCEAPDSLAGNDDNCQINEIHVQHVLQNCKRYSANLLADRIEERLTTLALAQNANFAWCVSCNNGFLAPAVNGNREFGVPIRCNECLGFMCVLCQTKWNECHSRMSCNQFKKYLETQNNRDLAAIESIKKSGIECPKCRFVFDLARGGCLHFTCSVCNHQFCYGCKATFSSQCDHQMCKIKRPGLHAHHPRNCIYYMRDLDVSLLHDRLRKIGYKPNLNDLLNFFSLSSFKFRTTVLGKPIDSQCPVNVQMFKIDRFVDMHCGKPSFKFNVCLDHYKEYLCMKLMNQIVKCSPAD